MTNDQIKKIEDFAQGSMSPAERESFVRELAADQALAAAYDTYLAVETYMQDEKKYAGDNEVKTTLAGLGAEFFSSAPQTAQGTALRPEPLSPAPARLPANLKRNLSTRMPVYRWLAAAVVLGLVAAGTGYLLTHKNRAGHPVAAAPAGTPVPAGRQKRAGDTGTQSAGLPVPVKKAQEPVSKPAAPDAVQGKQLFAAYFNTDTIPAQKDALLEEAFGQYQSGDYRNAAAAFENAALDLSARGREGDAQLSPFYAQYYRAICLQALGRDAEAIRQLEQISIPADPFLQAKVSWYRALSYVRTGKLQKALPLLRQLQGNDAAGGYRQKAGRLVAELQK